MEVGVELFSTRLLRCQPPQTNVTPDKSLIAIKNRMSKPAFSPAICVRGAEQRDVVEGQWKPLAPAAILVQVRCQLNNTY